MRVEREDGAAAALWGPWRHQVCRETYCHHGRSYGPIRVFFRASCSWWSEGLRGQSFSLALPIQALRGIPCLGSFSVVPHVRHIEGSSWWGSYSVDWCIRQLKGGTLAGVLLCNLDQESLKGAPWVGSYSVVQCVRCLMGQPLYCWAANAGDAGLWGERLWWWLHPLHVTQHYCLASMAARLFSTGIWHLNLLPHIPSVSLSTVSSSPHPGVAPESLNSSSQLLPLPGDLCSCPAYVWLWQGLSDSHSI